jgi:hypothetical protein
MMRHLRRLLYSAISLSLEISEKPSLSGGVIVVFDPLIRLFSLPIFLQRPFITPSIAAIVNGLGAVCVQGVKEIDNLPSQFYHQALVCAIFFFVAGCFSEVLA